MTTFLFKRLVDKDYDKVWKIENALESEGRFLWNLFLEGNFTCILLSNEQPE